MGTFKLPDLGEGLAEAEIIQWHVKPGDRVVVDQPMVSVETAKAVVEVPVPYSGTVTALHGAVGAIIATGAPLVDFDSGTVVGTMPATSEEEYAEPAIERNRARGGARARTLPAARVLARRLGVDLSSLSGSGQAGLITLDDVLRHAPAAGNASSQSRAEPNLDPNAEPLRGPRRAMAHAMALTRDQITGSTVCDDADIHHWQRRGDYMVRLVRAMIAACRIEPALNAWFDAANNLRTLHRHIDLGIAVDTPAGLLAPVLRDVGAKSPEAVRAALMALKDAAHQRTTAPDELRGFTIMLSNFGTLAGRYGIPLVAPPAVAILGAGKVRLDVVAVAGEAGAADQVAVHRRLPLSLSFDHRVVTGGEACRFLAALTTDLEKPD
jgi:2-oxoisovalerate dehydrogenase E2 component (dihydrolipoyl transacylase)